MDEIERQASEAWGTGKAVATVDLLTVDIPQHEVVQDAPATIEVEGDEEAGDQAQAS
jgi:hypothetical protein